MFEHDESTNRKLEAALIILVIGATALFATTTVMKGVVLNLFFLPVVLAGFFLGRYRAGVLAFFSVLSVSIVAFLDLSGFAATNNVAINSLALVTWSAVLGLAALMVGTLSDEHAAKAKELHEAYIGVVEVLSRYLQSANPLLEVRSKRVARLSQTVARQMRLSRQEIDDIGVAALLHDVGNIEITTKVIQKAVGRATPESAQAAERTFQGTDLIQSLGSVLRGALPLLVNQNDAIHPELGSGGSRRVASVGANIISTVRAYDTLVHSNWGKSGLASEDAIEQIRQESDRHPAFVVDALERVCIGSGGDLVETELLVAGGGV